MYLKRVRTQVPDMKHHLCNSPKRRELYQPSESELRERILETRTSRQAYMANTVVQACNPPSGYVTVARFSSDWPFFDGDASALMTVSASFSQGSFKVVWLLKVQIYLETGPEMCTPC